MKVHMENIGLLVLCINDAHRSHSEESLPTK